MTRPAVVVEPGMLGGTPHLSGHRLSMWMLAGAWHLVPLPVTKAGPL